jgi:uncharacterized LabA/DUF88 family protein
VRNEFGTISLKEKRKLKTKKSKTTPIAIFWDYENIPFRHLDWRTFVQALQTYITTHNVVVAKCFYRDLIVSDDDRENLQLIQHMKLKRVTGSEHNAVDNVLIQSCTATIRSKKDIREIIIISGDGDFLPLVRDLHNQNIKVSVVCPLAKGNLRLINAVELFPYETLIARPDSWWKYPQKKKKLPKKVQDYDPYAAEEKTDRFVYDDGDGEYQGYDYSAPAFEDDESDEEEIVHQAEEEFWY